MDLTSGNDTFYLYLGLIGSTDPTKVDTSVKNVTLDGLAGTDTLFMYDSYPSPYFTVTTSATGITTITTASGSVSLRNFEQIQFGNTTMTLGGSSGTSTTPTSGNDSLTGTTGNDSLAALAGNDTLTGLAGNDTLNGGSGTDSMVGGAGNDTYVVDVTADIVVEASGAGTDLVQVALTTAGSAYTLAANVENATITSTAAVNLVGNSLANTLTGNAAANIINGGAGVDTMVGGAGNDTYTIDSLSDVVTETSTGGTGLVRVAVASSGGSWTLAANVEKATLINTVSFNLIGNALANTLTGNAAANILNGGAGADTLIGGAGNDTYVIDSAGDVITEVSTGGTDSARVAIATAGGSWTLASSVEKASLTSTVAFNLTGNALANTLVGNAAANVLNGGAGKDVLAGGAGADTFVFSSALSTSSADTITDYDTGGVSDRIFLDDAIFTAIGITGSSSGVALSSTTANASKFCLGTQAASAEDRIIYDQSTGKLYYDATGSANGSTDQVQIALIGTTTHATLSASDFLIV